MTFRSPEEEWAAKAWGVTLPCGCTRDGAKMCFKHKLKTLQFSGRGKSPQTQMESRWDRDMPAYQRLRRNGLQPPQIDGCADLEQRADTQLEVEMGHLIPKTVLPQVTEGMAISKEIDWTPQDSAAAVKAKKVAAQ